jgi:hypothetical protein
MFLTRVCKKIHCCWRGNDMSHMLYHQHVNPYTLQTKNCTVNSISGVMCKSC